MHPIRKKRLTVVVGAIVGFGLAIGLLLFALRQNINHFFTPTELLEQNVSTKIKARVGGLVKEGSLIRQADSLVIHFTVTDKSSDIRVAYEGILPDLFREGQGVVVIGHYLGDSKFKADQVLAKHDENYMPREAYEALKQAAEKQQATENNSD